MITYEELQALPEEPELAFVEFENIMRTKAQELIVNVEQYGDANEYRLEYISKVIGAAKVYQIDAIKDYEVPKRNVNIYEAYKEFLLAVDHLQFK